MKLNSRSQYAVLVMLALAARRGKDSVPLSRIAGDLSVSLSYLESLVAKIRKAGLLRSERGPGGGYRLTRAPTKITIAEILQALDEQIFLFRRDELGPVSTGEAVFHARADALWQDVNRQIAKHLESVSLQDLMVGQVDLNGSAALDLDKPAAAPTQDI